MIDSTPVNSPPELRQGLVTSRITNALAQSIKDLQSGFNVGGPEGQQFGSYTLFAKVGAPLTDDDGDDITGFYDGYQFGGQPNPDPQDDIEQSDIGTLSKSADLTLINIGELSGGVALGTNTYVAAVWAGYDINGRMMGMVISSTGGNGNWWRVVKDGGVAGTNTANCSFTYSIYPALGSSPLTTPTGTPIATSVALTGSRSFDSVTYTTGHYASGYMDPGVASSNNMSGIVLITVDEKLAEEGCT